MTKEHRSNKESKKKPLLSPKEKKAAKRNKDVPDSVIPKSGRQ